MRGGLGYLMGMLMGPVGACSAHMCPAPIDVDSLGVSVYGHGGLVACTGRGPRKEERRECRGSCSAKLPLWLFRCVRRAQTKYRVHGGLPSSPCLDVGDTHAWMLFLSSHGLPSGSAAVCVRPQLDL